MFRNTARVLSVLFAAGAAAAVPVTAITAAAAVATLAVAAAGCAKSSKSAGTEDAVCGNQECEEGETALMCPEDCGCGNFIVNEGEECDGANLDGQSCVGLGYDGGTLTCRPDCTFNTIMCIGNVCGNGIIEVSEHCDASDLNGQSCVGLGFDGGTLTCSNECRYDVSGCTGSGCGDGVKDADEDCDGDDLGGADCNDVGYASGTLACAGDCTFDISGCDTPLLCGNGVIDAGEDCDEDGVETATCDLDCTVAECGDGLRNQTAGEACDDGGESANCDPDCTPAECGDDYLNASAGEECDATNFGSATCQTEGFYAGDLACTQQCALDLTGCHNCGNGTVDTGETCDDAGESANCDADCTAVQCGDGVLNQTAGEQCDDGNTTNGDGCSSTCAWECDPTENIALMPGVVATSSGGGTTPNNVGPEKMIDGYLEADCASERFHWVDAPNTPSGDWIQLDFPATVTVQRVWFDTTNAYSNNCGCNDGRSLAGGTFQWWDGGNWVTDGSDTGHTDDWEYVLSAPVQTTRIRLYDIFATNVTGQQSNPVIFEWQVFACN